MESVGSLEISKTSPDVNVAFRILGANGILTTWSGQPKSMRRIHTEHGGVLVSNGDR